MVKLTKITPPNNFDIKRLISGITAFTVAFSTTFQTKCTAGTVKAAEETNAKIVYGDLNEDGTINVFDLMHLKNMLFKDDTNNVKSKISDVDGDGETTFKDITEMGKYLIGNVPLLKSEVRQDTDKDGICDYLEGLLGTDPADPDSDKDELSDFEEIYFLDTDPKQMDTEITSSQRDVDNDGLLSIDEHFKYYTDPYNPDSDGDGLCDGKEIEFGTNPLVIDTDDDGISDFGEVELGIDPLNSKSDGVNEDGNRIFEQKMAEQCLSSVNTDDNSYCISVSAKTGGYIGDFLKIDESVYSEFLKNNSICGKIIDVRFDSENQAASDFEYKLGFEMKDGSGTDNYMVFYYAVDDYLLVPFETEYSGNTMFVTFNESATFCIVDISNSDFSDIQGENPIDFNDDSKTISNTIYSDDPSGISDEELKEFLRNKGIVFDISTVKDIVTYTFNFEVSDDFSVKGWNSSVKQTMLDSYQKLSDEFILNTQVNFFVNENGSIYVVSAVGSINKLIDDVDEYLSYNHSDIRSAGMAYNKVTGKSSLRYSYGSMLGISNMNGGTTFNIDCGKSVYSFDISNTECNVTGPFSETYNQYTNQIMSPADRIYNIVKNNPGFHRVRNSFIGSTLFSIELSENDIINYLKSNGKIKSGIDSNGDGIDDMDSYVWSLVSLDTNGNIVYPTFGNVTSKRQQTQTGMELFSKKAGCDLNKAINTTYLPSQSMPNIQYFNSADYPDSVVLDRRITDQKNVFLVYMNPVDPYHSYPEEAAWMAKYLYNDSNCEFYSFSYADEFVDIWNNKIPDKMQNLHIYCHGSPGEIDLYTNTKPNMYGDELTAVELINALSEKTVKKAYLYSCNGGTHSYVSAIGSIDDKYSSVEKALPVNETNHKQISAAMGFACKLKGAKIETLKDSCVDYFNYNLAPIYPLDVESIPYFLLELSGQPITAIAAYNFLESDFAHEHIDKDYPPTKRIYYPLINGADTGDDFGEWIYVSYNYGEFSEKSIGKRWES